MVDTKELFNRLKRELDKRRKEREREEEEEMSMTDESSSTISVEASSSGINMAQRHSSTAARRKKPRRGSFRTSRKIIDSSPSPLSLSLYSSMKLPTACLNEHDGCDEAELIARAKRCKEILKLSQEAKEAEDARVKAAKNKPLVWAKPTFELVPATPDTTSSIL